MSGSRDAEPVPVNPASVQPGRSSTGLRTSRLVLVGGVVLAVLLVLGCAVGLWRLRVQTLDQARSNLDRLALVLAEQTERSFQGIDLVIEQARADLEGVGGTAGQDGQALHRLLGTKIFGLPQGQALLLFGADGTLLAHSREFPTPKINAADRDYFVAQKNMSGDGLFISEPMRNRVNGRWMVSLSRHYQGAHGEDFGGVIMAAVEVEYFSGLYQALQLPAGVAILLQRLDGTVLIRYPGDTPGDGGSSLGPLGSRPTPTWLRLDQTPTLVSVRPLPTLPLAIGLLLPEPVALAPWRALGLAIALGTAAAATAILALIALLAVQVARLEQREAARARLAAIVESSSDAIIGKDLNGIMTSWNHGAEVVFGYRAAEVLGRSVDLLAPPEYRAETRVLSRRVRRGEGVTRYETVRLHKDGNRIEVSLTLSPIRDAKGNVVGISTITRDITENKHAQEEIGRYRDHLEALVTERTAALSESNRQLGLAKEKAEAANHAKSVFLANMSHEIRTPMNAILGFAQILQRAGTLPPPERENVEIIYRSGRNLLTLINDVLEMSRIEAGRNDVQCKTFDLEALLDDLYVMFKVAAGAKGLDWQVERAVGLPRYLVADEGKLRQMLINLIGNAIKFTDTGGVVLRARCGEGAGDGLVLQAEVEDTGPGIAEDEQERLFEASVQTASGHEHGGTGLGLAISRRFARLMGGDIGVRSAPDHGSVFRLRLPVTLGTVLDVHHRHRPRVIGLKPDQGEVRVLITDDKADNRLFLRRLLEPVGFTVHEAVNGQETLALWQDWHPRLILMDIVMPVMDGHEATRRIRAMPEGDKVKIVALSASAFDEDRDAVLATGADDFVRKPASAEDLLALIGRHLGLAYECREDPEALPASGAGQPRQSARLPMGIAPALLDRMRETVTRSDDIGLAALIKELSPDQPDQKSLADTLRHLVGRFDWDALDALLGPEGTA